MKPEEKATQLIEKFRNDVFTKQITTLGAKRCVEILCDEIIAELKAVNAYNDISGIGEIDHITNGSFWQKVKQFVTMHVRITNRKSFESISSYYRTSLVQTVDNFIEMSKEFLIEKRIANDPDENSGAVENKSGDAVGFAEWIDDNRYLMVDGDYKQWSHGEPGEERFTTEQLYSIYQSQKEAK